MRIQDFSNVWNTNDEKEIERILATRYENKANAFWLSHGEHKYPYMLLLVNGELANLHYFPKDRNAGLRSMGAVEGLEPGGMSTFYLTREGEEQEVLNGSIITFKHAVSAAREFAKLEVLPRLVEWFEL